MAEPSYDRSGSARRALQEIYRDYGLQGIDDDALLNRMLPDLLGGSPRETSLLMAAASADVGQLLTSRIQGGMAVDSAVRDVAAVLADRNALDQNASVWVVSEYAAALGQTLTDVTPPPAPPTPAPAPPAPQAPPPRAPQPANPDDLTQMDTGTTPWSPPPPTGPRKSKLPLVLGLVAGLVVLVVLCVIGAVWLLSDDCKGDDCTATTTSSGPTSTGPSTPGVTTPAVTPSSLAGMLPVDLNPAIDCDPFTDDLIKSVTGVLEQLKCTEGSSSDIAASTVYAYRFRDKAAMENGLTALNTGLNFKKASAAKGCPPASGDTDGVDTWHVNSDPNKTLGVLECYTSQSNRSVLIWSDERTSTIFRVVSAAEINLDTLTDWWRDNA